MKPSYIAGCLIISLVGAEICESKDLLFADEHSLSFGRRSTNTLVGNPHTHFELDTEDRATTAAPFSVSGGQQAEEMFRLFVHPAASGFKLIGHPVSPEPDGRPSQSMYGVCSNVESLSDVLLKAELPSPQIDAIRRTAIAGNTQEIGGSHSPVMRLFRRSQLEQIGMAFRPLD
jgi:hypothetical protein